MILQAYESFLSQPLALWVANCDDKNVPELVRCTGLLVLADLTSITFFIPARFATKFIDNIKVNTNLALSTASIPTYESYQFKGLLQTIRDCTPAEIEFQKEQVNAFSETVSTIGFSKEAVFNSYFHQPSFAGTFHVTDVFEQTPRKGTGKLISQKGI